MDVPFVLSIEETSTLSKSLMSEYLGEHWNQLLRILEKPRERQLRHSKI